MNIIRNLAVAVLMTIVTTVLLGVAYPLVVTALAQVVFPDQANGQLIVRNGQRRRIATHRAAVLLAGLLSSEAIGRRCRLRRGEFSGKPARSDEQEAR